MPVSSNDLRRLAMRFSDNDRRADLIDEAADELDELRHRNDERLEGGSDDRA